MENQQPLVLPRINNIRILNGMDILMLTDVEQGDIAIVNNRERYINITGKNDSLDDWKHYYDNSHDYNAQFTEEVNIFNLNYYDLCDEIDRYLNLKFLLTPTKFQDNFPKDTQSCSKRRLCPNTKITRRFRNYKWR